MDRRAFCLYSASGVLAMAALGAPPAARSVSGAAPPPFERVLFDSRFAEGRAFGAAGIRAGLSVAAFHGDVTDVWIRHLKPHWTANGGPTAGLTTRAGLFCLEQLAADHWLRVVARTRVEPARDRRGADPAGDELVAWVIARSWSTV